MAFSYPGNEPITESLETARCESTEGRMRSRCCGLIESQELMGGIGDIELCVGFLHRTVLESKVAAQLIASLFYFSLISRVAMTVTGNLRRPFRSGRVANTGCAGMIKCRLPQDIAREGSITKLHQTY